MHKVQSSRRAAGLKSTDYDHEIITLDNEASRPQRSNNTNDIDRVSTQSDLIPHDNSSNQPPSPSSPHTGRGGEPGTARNSGETPEPRLQERPLDEGRSRDDLPQQALRPSIEIQEPTPQVFNGQVSDVKPKKPQIHRESTIDVMYENERGALVCGAAFFSSQALGSIDASPWTNVYHRPSPTNIYTAQVPDPSWEWAWSEWHLNQQDGMDDSGWEYSFAFSKKFSWHGPKWYSSFVRRRAWTRKRVKRSPSDISADPHIATSEYFSIRPASERLRTSHASMSSSRPPSKTSMTQLSSLDPDAEKQDIEDMQTLLKALRIARIDREKLEAVESYLEHAMDLGRLEENMHEIMSLFVFQASRRLLLSHLTQIHDETGQALDNGKETGSVNGDLRDRSHALQAAVKHADEEVRRLAYWSDVKHMANSGESTGAVEGGKGWHADWQGLDDSGPVEPNFGKLP